MTSPHLQGHLFWLASRASGIVAIALLSLSVGIGLAMSLRLVPARRRRATLALHEYLAVSALGAIALHGLTLLGDGWLRPGVTGIALPFASSYRPVWTGMGVAAGYLAAALGPSFHLRRWIGGRRWRRAHRFTLIAYGLALIHTLGAGTDAGTTWLRGLLLIAVAPTAALALGRALRRAGPVQRRDTVVG